MSKQYNLLMTELSEVRRELLSHLGKKKGQLLMEDHAIVAKIGNLLPALMRKALAEAKVVIATADTAAINSGIREMCEEGKIR